MSKRNFLEPYKFRNGMVINNRIVMAPMTTKSSFFDGALSNDEINYYKIRSGVGMIITGVANVDDGGRGFEGELSVTNDRFIPGLRELATAIKSNGSKAILQIFSAGRMSTSAILRGRQPYSASAVAAPREGAELPRELTDLEIKQLIIDFGQATRRAIIAGFDGVELHGANTYLLQQFVSPHSNRRTDHWGGTFEKRIQFPLEVIKETRAIVEKYADSEFLIGYRFSPEEIEEPGIRIEDTLKFINILSDQPINYLHTSMGNFKRSSLNNKNDKEELTDKFLKTIANRVPLITVGSISTPDEASSVIDKGSDFAAIGRELIREPQWLKKVQEHDEASIRYQISPSDMNELGIPRGLQRSLLTEFLNVINFSNQSIEDYLDKPAPMEGLTTGKVMN
ncbi:NADH-dependent flavin oxidoreductase [Enterococcus sp. LJL90]